MGKRRRERDRPKAAPDAQYNPNKRIVLSYASDEDDGGVNDEQHDVDLVDGGAQHANFQIAPYPEGEDGSGEERNEQEKVEEEGEGDGVEDEEQPSRHKSRGGKGTSGGSNVRKNQATNQRPALGSLAFQWDGDGETDEDEYDSTGEEAMAYLNDVRVQRQNMPFILTQPHHNEIIVEGKSVKGEDQVCYDDGVYVSRTESATVLPNTTDEFTDPQHVFTAALKARFLLQRETLRLPTSLEGLAELDERHPISCPQRSKKAHAEWVRLLSTRAPLPAQVQSMDEDTVGNLLELIQKNLLIKHKGINHITSAWIFSLLARLDDVGNMTNDQVYPLREFGKKAIFVQLSFSSPEMAVQLEKNLNQGEEDQLDEGPSERATGAFERDGNPDSSPSDALPGMNVTVTDNTMATLDMIIAVVGEVFGQKDLLEFRLIWKADETVD